MNIRQKRNELGGLPRDCLWIKIRPPRESYMACATAYLREMGRKGRIRNYQGIRRSPSVNKDIRTRNVGGTTVEFLRNRAKR